MFGFFSSKNFTFKDIPDLSGKVAIVTGANSGIGYVTARELARNKAHVFVAGRNKSSCEEAIEKIKKETGNGNVELLELDLANLNKVKQSADNWLKRNLKLHILVNNAGIMATPFKLSVDGIEEQFATNHMGHFLFTRTLLPTIESSAPSRIVNVSSTYHRGAPKIGVDFENLNKEGVYPPHVLYGQTKLANILFTNELNERLQGKNVYVNCLHPGFIPHTGLAKGLGETMGRLFLTVYHSLSVFTMSIEDGAITQLYLATSNEVEEKNYRGNYFVPFAKLSKTSHRLANDDELAKKLWEFSEQTVNEKLGVN